ARGGDPLVETAVSAFRRPRARRHGDPFTAVPGHVLSHARARPTGVLTRSMRTSVQYAWRTQRTWGPGVCVGNEKRPRAATSSTPPPLTASGIDAPAPSSTTA